MHNLFYLLPLLACPLGMALIGGIIWLFARANAKQTATTNELPDREQRLALLRSQQDAVAAELRNLTADQGRDRYATTV